MSVVEVGQMRRGPSGTVYEVKLVDSDGWVYLREQNDEIRHASENVWISDLEFSAREQEVAAWKVITAPITSDEAQGGRT